MALVSIVLAVYKPNLIFFEKLLESLNEQTYSDIEILIIDDSEDEDVHKNINKVINGKIKNFPYAIYRNEKNIGSNKTFEILTELASGHYIAYCDQDDIWKADKIAKLVELTKTEGAVLSYSDLSIIDADDNQVAKSFKDINKRVKHKYGEDVFDYLLRRNSVTGCTMLINSEVAKLSVPFCHDYYVHDHWLTLIASTKGKISYINEPLVKYRIHENNQIGASMLNDIHSKDDYINKKLISENNKYEYLIKNYNFIEIYRNKILLVKKNNANKIEFFKEKNIKTTSLMVKNFKQDWQLTTFEIILSFSPKTLSEFWIRRMKN